jgi:Tfp pilus assembly protein PilF
MSHSLNLVAGLLAAARDLQQLGRHEPALNLLHRLAAFRHLAPEIAEEVHRRLADGHAARDEFKKARRHLTIALTYRPQHPAYHHRMAAWIEADPDAAIDRAGRYHRRAVLGEPDNAEYWADYGAYLLGAGRTLTGRKALYRAFRLGSHDVDLVGRIAAALRDAGLWRDARRLLRRALFQGNRDRRFQALWQQHQFAQLYTQQQADGDASATAERGRPVVLPFLRAARPMGPLEVEGKIIRIDRATDATIPMPKHASKSRRNRRSN